MDKHLLTLWKAISSGPIKQIEIADLLQISSKQTTRYIQKWSTDCWLTFTSGRGRGNISNLHWLKNVEAIFEDNLMKIIDEQPVEISSKYLLWDWSTDSKLRLLKKFSSKFGYVQSTKDKLIVPRKNPFLTIHPLEAADVHSANIVATIFNRLVSIDENGVVSPELSHSWDLQNNRIRIYLKKDIKFHDGSVLTADIVVNCLEKLQNHPFYQNLWKPVKKIVAVTSLVIDINFSCSCSYFLQMLGSINASIYKETENHLYGTGSFYVQENNEQKTVILAFKDYYGERALLDAVEFVQVPKDYDVVYRSSVVKKDDQTFAVDSDSGFGVVLMNTYRNTAIQQKEVRDYIHYIISKYRHEISQVDCRYSPNHQGCLIGQSKIYKIPKVKKPEFTKPLVLKIVNYTENTTLWLKDILQKEGIPIELKWVSFKDTIGKTSDNEQVDLFIHGEVFEMNQNFSFFSFLQNGHSSLAEIVNREVNIRDHLTEYSNTPFQDWTDLNLTIEKTLIENSILIPLYYSKRQIPFSADLMNINMKHFGYVDFSKLWVRPEIRE
ncbi:ABC transporter substrate-binding protein [Psychrobacillus antarcticus]|uniref:ABC transporter substrate-binding protein n=1 Tax=Psychrobacillus antarcticus TaxID=2879115 RepID=UPI0024081425|nr:ABC transporter substrate-binding protein [Psychrobacillus antarcticus]